MEEGPQPVVFELRVSLNWRSPLTPYKKRGKKRSPNLHNKTRGKGSGSGSCCRGLLHVQESRKAVSSMLLGPRLPGLTMAAKAEVTRLPAGVTQCGRNWKWGYGGRSTQGFKLRHGVAMLSWPCGLKGCKRSPTDPP